MSKEWAGPRPVVPGCAGCAMAHPDFGRSVNPISTREDRFCPPGFSDLPTAPAIWPPMMEMPLDCAVYSWLLNLQTLAKIKVKICQFSIYYLIIFPQLSIVGNSPRFFSHVGAKTVIMIREAGWFSRKVNKHPKFGDNFDIRRQLDHF